MVQLFERIIMESLLNFIFDFIRLGLKKDLPKSRKDFTELFMWGFGHIQASKDFAMFNLLFQPNNYRYVLNTGNYLEEQLLSL